MRFSIEVRTREKKLGATPSRAKPRSPTEGAALPRGESLTIAEPRLQPRNEAQTCGAGSLMPKNGRAVGVSMPAPLRHLSRGRGRTRVLTRRASIHCGGGPSSVRRSCLQSRIASTPEATSSNAPTMAYSLPARNPGRCFESGLPDVISKRPTPTTQAHAAANAVQNHFAAFRRVLGVNMDGV